MSAMPPLGSAVASNQAPKSPRLPSPLSRFRFQLSAFRFSPPLAAFALPLLLVGCAAPMGADRVATKAAYSQVDASALRTGEPSTETVSILHRYNLVELARKNPEEAVRKLHEKALATGERGLLFALAEMS